MELKRIDSADDGKIVITSPADYKEKDARLAHISETLEEMSRNGEFDIEVVFKYKEEARRIAEGLKTYLLKNFGSERNDG